METIEDQEFGRLNWNPRFWRWEGKATMADGTPFDLNVKALAYHQSAAIAKTNPDKTITMESRTAFRNLRSGDKHIRIKIAEEYVDAYSEWQDGESITSEDFQSRLQLESIEFYPKGEAAVYYWDDEMLGGHYVIAHLEPSGALFSLETFG